MTLLKIAMSVVGVFAVQSVALADYYPGSYRKSCIDIVGTPYSLEARCIDLNGYYQDTRLDHPYFCRGDIINNNGQLECNEGSSSSRIPRGSYQNSCRNIKIVGDTLYADCRNRRRGYTHTILRDVSFCQSDILNRDGNLMCE